MNAAATQRPSNSLLERLDQGAVICAEGYTSSLAAAALQDLGLTGATDVAGGYQAWEAGGLPTAHPAERTVVIAPGASPAFADS